MNDMEVCQEMKNKTLKTVLARIMFVLTFICVIIIFVKLGPDEFPQEMEALVYISHALLFLVLLVVFYKLSARIISFWESFFCFFGHNNENSQEKK